MLQQRLSNLSKDSIEHGFLDSLDTIILIDVMILHASKAITSFVKKYWGNK